MSSRWLEPISEFRLTQLPLMKQQPAPIATSQMAHVSPQVPVQEQMAAADRYFQSGARITATAFEVEHTTWPETDPVPVVRLTVSLPTQLQAMPFGMPVATAATGQAANCMCHPPGPLPPLVKTPRELLAEAEGYIACAPSVLLFVNLWICLPLCASVGQTVHLRALPLRFCLPDCASAPPRCGAALYSPAATAAAVE